MQLTRRTLLTTAATTATLGLAGCLGSSNGPVDRPVVTDDRIDENWRLVDEEEGEVFSRDVGPITLRALARTDLYEHAGLADALAEAFDASGSPVLFFASRIDLRPGLDTLPLGVGRGEVMSEVTDAADRAFRQQLRSAGIEDVRRTTETTVEVDAGHSATLQRYAGNYALDGEFELDTGQTHTVSDTLELEGKLATWHDGADALLAGGVYPTTRIDDAFRDALDDAAADLGDFVGDDAAAILSRNPAGFEEEVTALVLSVE